MISIQRHTQTGAGLVELMVGMFISLLVMIAVMGSVAFYQNSKKSGTSLNSAVAGAMSGLYLLGNDVRFAGLGLTVNGSMACNTLNAYYNGTVVSDGLLLAPLVINNSGANNVPDNISVMYGSNVSSGAPASLLSNMSAATDPVRANLSTGNELGLLALLAIPGSTSPCTLIEVTNVDTTGTSALISHDANGSLYNPPNPGGVFTQAPLYSTAAYILNTGTFRWITWRINNNRLQAVDNITGTVEEVADNIVQMQAEYGVTNGVNPGITQWVPATGAWANLNANTIPRIRAVRIALVARSTHRERNVDNNGVCTTTTQAPISWPGSPAVDLSALPNWQCYRYSVLRMVFPLKNVVWGT